MYCLALPVQVKIGVRIVLPPSVYDARRSLNVVKEVSCISSVLGDLRLRNNKNSYLYRTFRFPTKSIGRRRVSVTLVCIAARMCSGNMANQNNPRLLLASALVVLCRIFPDIMAQTRHQL